MVVVRLSSDFFLIRNSPIFYLLTLLQLKSSESTFRMPAAVLQQSNCAAVQWNTNGPTLATGEVATSKLCSEAQPTSFCSLRNGPRRESANGSSSFSSLSRAEHWFKTIGAHKNWNQNGSIFSANQQICILYIYV